MDLKGKQNMSPKQAFRKAGKSLLTAFPMIVGILVLISLFDTFVPVSSYKILFRGTILDPVVGALLGSVVAGNPVTSYIISGALLKQGISLLTVTAFLTAWVTVGVIQLPAEIQFLGKKFALLRNVSAFVLSLVVAGLTVLIWSVL
jgi:uncharacterized membrane protein YraQ (UPF0718 family)